MTGITKSRLKSIGYEARDEHAILGDANIEGCNVRGCCVEITEYIYTHLIDQTPVPKSEVTAIKCQVNGEEMHYIVSINAEYVSDYPIDDGEIYIDASIDQFCTEQEEINRVNLSFGSYEDMERVDIIPPDNPKRERYQNLITGVF